MLHTYTCEKLNVWSGKKTKVTHATKLKTHLEDAGAVATCSSLPYLSVALLCYKVYSTPFQIN
jgi:hypothetical protein